MWMTGSFDFGELCDQRQSRLWGDDRMMARTGELQQILLHAYNCKHDNGNCPDLTVLCSMAKGTVKQLQDHSLEACAYEDWTHCGQCRIWAWLRPNVRKCDEGPEMIAHCVECTAKPGRCRRGIPCKNGKKTWAQLCEHVNAGCDAEVIDVDVTPECQQCTVHTWVNRVVAQRHNLADKVSTYPQLS